MITTISIRPSKVRFRGVLSKFYRRAHAEIDKIRADFMILTDFYSENAQIYTVAGVGSAGESMYMEKINVGTGDTMRQVFKSVL